jgi:hypothetical protein
MNQALPFRPVDRDAVRFSSRTSAERPWASSPSMAAKCRTPGNPFANALRSYSTTLVRRWN